jgi:hypothetical protein
MIVVCDTGSVLMHPHDRCVDFVLRSTMPATAFLAVFQPMIDVTLKRRVNRLRLAPVPNPTHGAICLQGW